MKLDKSSLQPLNMLSRNPYYRQELYTLKWNQKKLKKGTCCWHCGYEIGKTWYPKPILYDSDCNKWEVQGLFCTLSCVKAQIKIEKGYFMGKRFELLTKMAKDIYGHKELIPCAPDRPRFTKYGGQIEYKQWLKDQGTAPTMYLREAPFVDSPLVIEYKFKDMSASRTDMIKSKLIEPKVRKKPDAEQPKQKKAKTGAGKSCSLRNLMDLSIE